MIFHDVRTVHVKYRSGMNQTIASSFLRLKMGRFMFISVKFPDTVSIEWADMNGNQISNLTSSKKYLGRTKNSLNETRHGGFLEDQGIIMKSSHGA